MSISLAVATFNKDDFIIRTLESAYDWVDEIILVYGSPEDEKVAQMRAFDTAKKITIHFTDNPPMFHINKQKAIERCTKDWIVQLDTDEVISPELQKEIVTTLANHKEGDPVAYWMPRLNHFLGKPLRKGGQYPDPTIRLYKNGVAHLPCKTVHEQVEVKGTVGRLQNDLLHYPYPTFYTYLRKWSRYGDIDRGDVDMSSFRPSFGGIMSYFFIKPTWWFLKTYFRHRGYVDGFPGYVFSLFSGLRYWLEYIDMYERYTSKNS